MKLLRYLWLFLFVLFLGLASFLAEDLFFPRRPSFPQTSLEWTIFWDLKKLKEEKKLPEYLNDVRQIFIVDRRTQSNSLNWLEISKFLFPQKANGSYDLQIEIFEINNEKAPPKKRVLFCQMSLFEEKTKNKVWELSRSYNLE